MQMMQPQGRAMQTVASSMHIAARALSKDKPVADCQNSRNSYDRYASHAPDSGSCACLAVLDRVCKVDQESTPTHLPACCSIPASFHAFICELFPAISAYMHTYMRHADASSGARATLTGACTQPRIGRSFSLPCIQLLSSFLFVPDRRCTNRHL